MSWEGARSIKAVFIRLCLLGFSPPPKLDEVWVGVKNPLSHSSVPPLPSSLVFHFQEEFFLLPHFSPFRPYLVLTYPQPSIIAYAACCQLDSEDRPLAGTIVYCAQHLTSPSLSHSDIIMVTAAR